MQSTVSCSQVPISPSPTANLETLCAGTGGGVCIKQENSAAVGQLLLPTTHRLRAQILVTAALHEDPGSGAGSPTQTDGHVTSTTALLPVTASSYVTLADGEGGSVGPVSPDAVAGVVGVTAVGDGGGGFLQSHNHHHHHHQQEEEGGSHQHHFVEHQHSGVAAVDVTAPFITTASVNGQMAYSAVYAALNDGAVAMYTGGDSATSFYTNGAQSVMGQGQLLPGGTYMLQQATRVTSAATTSSVDAANITVNNTDLSQHQQQHQQQLAVGRGTQQTSVGESTVVSSGGAGADSSFLLAGGGVENAPPVAADELLIGGQRMSPATAYDANCVQWLQDNYEVAEGVSLPRSTLYNHYLRHCADNRLDPVNAASFGKLIRQVFYGLRTRRLGTRGNSKYHYYGIRVKPESPLNRVSSDDESCSSVSTFGRHCVGASSSTGCSTAADAATAGRRAAAKKDDFADNSNDCLQAQKYLGDASQVVPALIDIDPTSVVDGLPADMTCDDVANFASIYREHCEVLLDAVVTLRFASVEIVWQQFWRSAHAADDLLDDDDPERVMPKRMLYRLCECQPVLDHVRHVDRVFYQNLVDVLMPDVLRAIPSSLTQAIRNFAKSLEGWLRGAMEGVPSCMLRVKLTSVAALAQTLRRYTSLNHLAQAARAVLHNGGQIAQMLADLNRVDFANVQEQASWVCQCDDTLVQRLETDFKTTLQRQTSLEQWAEWLRGVVDVVLQPLENRRHFARAARQFLLKWSFYSSMVIRDLTLRSAASFGSFHLIRLLYDEYMFYLVEHRVARVTGQMPIAVMTSMSSPGASHTLSSVKLYSESASSSSSELMMPAGGEAVMATFCLDRCDDQDDDQDDDADEQDDVTSRPFKISRHN